MASEEGKTRQLPGIHFARQTGVRRRTASKQGNPGGTVADSHTVFYVNGMKKGWQGADRDTKPLDTYLVEFPQVWHGINQFAG